MSELLNFILASQQSFQSRNRLISLYADFSNLKQTNPDGYAANSYAWRSALERACRAGFTPAPFALHDVVEESSSKETARTTSSLVMRTGDELLHQLENGGMGRPLSIGDVVNDAVAELRLIPMHRFLFSRESLQGMNKNRWVPSLTIPSAYEIGRWLLSQIGIGRSNSTSLVSGDFVVTGNLEEASSAIIRYVSNHSNTSSSLIYSLETFTATFKDIIPDSKTLSPLDTIVVLTHLSRDKQAISISRLPQETTETTSRTEQPLVIKFKPPNSTALTRITQQDETIASLHTLDHKLSVQQSSIEGRIRDLDSKLNPLLSQSSTDNAVKARALALLRQKKALQATLQQRIDSQAQVENTLSAIDDAVTNVEITRAMESSTTTLQDLNKQVGGVEGVEKVMDTVADAQAETDSVGHVLRQDAEAQMDVDEADVEAELEAMLRDGDSPQDREHAQPREAESINRITESLPEVPNTEPTEATPRRNAARSERDMEEVMERRLSNMSLDEPVNRE